MVTVHVFDACWPELWPTAFDGRVAQRRTGGHRDVLAERPLASLVALPLVVVAA
jgi:hypothetical protein